MKKQNGITLIALVITIIVLLILAGVSISAITGENGIISKAKQAKEETEAAQKKEEEDLESALEYINKNESGNESDIVWGVTYTGMIGTQEVNIVFYENNYIELYFDVEKDGVTITYFKPIESNETNIYQEDKVILEEMVGTVSADGTQITFDNFVLNLNSDKVIVPFNLNFEEIYTEDADFMGNAYIFYKNGSMKHFFDGEESSNSSGLTVEYMIYNSYVDEKTGNVTDLRVIKTSGGTVLTVTEDGSEISWMAAIPFKLSDLSISSENRNFIGYTDTVTEIIIPETFSNEGFIEGREFKVVSIGEEAFSGCTNLTSVVIPRSVTNVGEKAFYGCSGLTDVYYEGTEEEWNDITIGASNENLTGATIHYEYNQ